MIFILQVCAGLNNFTRVGVYSMKNETNIVLLKITKMYMSEMYKKKENVNETVKH